MKKTFLISLLTLLGLAQCIWAQTETFDLFGEDFENSQAAETVVGTHCTINFLLGENKNNLLPTYYDNGQAVRVYCGNIMRVCVSEENIFIEQITLVFGTGDRRNAITVDNGSFSVDTWTGFADEVNFSVEGSSGHRRIQQVQVTYAAPVATPVISGTTPFVGSTSVTITAETGTTIHYTTNGETPTPSSSTYSGPFTINKSLTVKAIAIRNNNNVTSNVASMVFAKEVPEWTGSGTKTDPYIVNSSTVLNQLADIVNGGEPFAGVYFKQTANISYNYSSAWNDTSSDENNFTPIGTANVSFAGIFDGNGFTISGIRVNGGYHQGLFGKTDGAVIRNVTLADTRITAKDRAGGIVGMNQGTIEQCHVKADVCIHAPNGNIDEHGGVVGINYAGSITACTSEVTLSIADNITTGCAQFGGIVGDNSGSIINCLAVNVKLPSPNQIRLQNNVKELGAIVGLSSNLPSGCLYHDCTVGGTPTATGIGRTMADVTGAEPGYTVTSGTEGLSLVLDDDGTKDLIFYGKGYLYDGKIYATNGTSLPIELNATGDLPFSNVSTTSGSITGSGSNYTLTLGQGDAVITADLAIVLRDADDNSAAIANGAAITSGGKTIPVVLQGRTLYKDGNWNTLCLPFEVSTTSAPLSGDGAVAMTLDTETSCFSDGTLTLNFTDVEGGTIPAGTPFIIKWNDNGSSHLIDPVFYDVVISEATNNATVTDVVSFIGTYSPVSITEEGDNTKLYLGAGNTLYYPSSAMSIGSCRAYFQLLGDLTAGEPTTSTSQGIKAFVLNFGEETGIETVYDSGFRVDGSGWYTLDGRRIDGKPSAKGIYVHDGVKVMIK